MTPVSETLRRTRLPFTHTTEGGIQSQPQKLVVKWGVENGALICRWASESDIVQSAIAD